MLEPMNKLTPFIESVEDCDNCVIVRMRAGCGSDLVRLGYFKGTEMQFRLMKFEPVRLNLFEESDYNDQAELLDAHNICTTCWNSNGSIDKPADVHEEIVRMLLESIAWDFNVDMTAPQGRGLCSVADRLTMPVVVSHLVTQADREPAQVFLSVNHVEVGRIKRLSESWDTVQVPASVLRWFAKLAPHVDIHAELEQKLQMWIGSYKPFYGDEDPRIIKYKVERMDSLDPVELSVATPEQLKELLTDSEQEQLRKRTVKVGGYFQIDIEQCPAADNRLSGWELTVTSADPLNHPVAKHMFISKIEVGDKFGLPQELPRVVVTDYRPKSEREFEIRFSN